MPEERAGMTEDLPKSVWSGSFCIFGVEMKCHTLDNGQRIIEADSMAAFFEQDLTDIVSKPGDFLAFQKWKDGG